MISMALEKCPRCELNYILDGGELCTVCRREVKGEYEAIDMTEMCSACGEHPAVSGNDLCIVCLKEMNRHNSAANGGDDTIMTPEDATIEIDSVSTMDEIEIDPVDAEMATEFGADGEFKDDEDDESMDDNGILSIDAIAEEENYEDEIDE